MPVATSAATAGMLLPQLFGLMGGSQVAPPAPAFNTPGNPVNALGLPEMRAASPTGGQNDIMSSLVGNPLKKPPKPGDKTMPEEPPGFFNQFFDTLDTNLHSPSKVLGLGLLSQLDPRLGGLGLLAGGFLGRK